MKKETNFSKMLLLVFITVIAFSTNSLFAVNISGTVTGNGTLEFYKRSANATDSITATVVNKLSAMVPIDNTTVLNMGDTIVVFANPASWAKVKSFKLNGISYNASPATVIIGSTNVLASADFINGNVLFSEKFGNYIGTEVFDRLRLPKAIAGDTIVLDNSKTSVLYSFAAGTNLKFLNPSGGTDPNAASLYTAGNSNAVTMTFVAPITGSNLQLKFKLNPNVAPANPTYYLMPLDAGLRISVNGIAISPCLNNTELTFFRKNLTRPLVSKYAYETPYIVVPISASIVNKIEIRSSGVSGKLSQFYFDNIQIISDSLPRVSAANTATAISISTAISGATILSDGGSPIVNYGLCWSRVPNPTIETGFKSTETVIGNSFQSTMTNLMGGIKYYVRAYATSAVGTAYGDQTSFTTLVGGNYETYKHLIIYGQSLSAAAMSYPGLSTENIPGNYVIGDQIWINYGNTVFNTLNPLTAKIANSFLVGTDMLSRKSDTQAECALIGTTNHIQLKSPDEKIIATSCGSGGMSIEQLSKESETKTFYKNNFENAIKSATQITQKLNANVYCPAIFWLQGEANYNSVETPSSQGLTVGSTATADKSIYKGFLLTLKNNMQNDIQNLYGQAEKPIFITYQVGGISAKGKELSIGMAQLEASNENEDIICAGPTYPVTDRGLHLDPNGYRWYGEMLGKVYYKTTVLKETFRPLQPQEIARTENANKLKLKFLVSHLPLVLDESLTAKAKDFGFEVYLDNVKQTITAVSITDDCVYLTCSTSLIGVVEVVYAGANMGGNGNLRDSDPYQAFYKYTDLDKKNNDGTFVYPRDATETTLRPGYEPKGADGNEIYDQLYPLYNFSVAFYYKLIANQATYSVPNLETFTGHINPSNDNDVVVFQSENSLVIKTSHTNNEVISISIINMSGSILNSYQTRDAKPRFSLQGLAKGVYIVRIKFTNQTKLKKIVIY